MFQLSRERLHRILHGARSQHFFLRHSLISVIVLSIFASLKTQEIPPLSTESSSSEIALWGIKYVTTQLITTSYTLGQYFGSIFWEIWSIPVVVHWFSKLDKYPNIYFVYQLLKLLTQIPYYVTTVAITLGYGLPSLPLCLSLYYALNKLSQLFIKRCVLPTEKRLGKNHDSGNIEEMQKTIQIMNNINLYPLFSHQESQIKSAPQLTPVESSPTAMDWLASSTYKQEYIFPEFSIPTISSYSTFLQNFYPQVYQVQFNFQMFLTSFSKSCTDPKHPIFTYLEQKQAKKPFRNIDEVFQLIFQSISKTHDKPRLKLAIEEAIPMDVIIAPFQCYELLHYWLKTKQILVHCDIEDHQTRIDYFIQHGAFKYLGQPKRLLILRHKARNLYHLFYLFSKVTEFNAFFRDIEKRITGHRQVAPLEDEFHPKSLDMRYPVVFLDDEILEVDYGHKQIELVNGTPHLGFFEIFFTEDSAQTPYFALADPGCTHSFCGTQITKDIGFTSFLDSPGTTVKIKSYGHVTEIPARYIVVEFTINEQSFTHQFLVDPVEILDRYTKTAKVSLQKAFTRNKYYFDQNKTGLEFEVGDVVYVENKYMITDSDLHNKELRNSLKTKFVGPYKIRSKLSPVNYDLELPVSSKRTSSFHISQLRRPRSVPDPIFKAPLRTVEFYKYADGSKEVEIRKLLNHKKVTKGYKIEVEFIDGSREWINMSALRKSADELLEAYMKKHPNLENNAIKGKRG